MAFVLNEVIVLRGNALLFPKIDLKIKPGELKVIMGPSGCGKSTLLAAIAGSLDANFSLVGDILLEGQLLNNLPIEQRCVGIQYQEDLLFPHLDVAGNLLFAMASGRRETRYEAVEQALKNAGLEGFAARDVATLSGGQRARVSLLRTLMAKPKLLLLDEPFSRLDQNLRESFRRFVFEQVEKWNIPALLVTHDIQDCPNGDYYALSQGVDVAC